MRVENTDALPVDRAEAERLVRSGDVPVAVVIPSGMGEGFQNLGFAANGPSIQVLADPSDPVAPQMVQGLLQKVAMTAAPDLVVQGGMKQFEQHAGALTADQRKAVDQWLPRLKASATNGTAASASSSAGPMGLGVTVVDVMRTSDRSGSLISFYAAGIGVMFLLFSCVSGAGGALLDEAAARTRAQLSGFSTILILTMSALGGSMFPRFMMNETMQKMGLLTFNGWALDGYLKVFWRNAAIWELWPQVLVLVLLAVTFLGVARLLGRRWELA